MVVLMLAVLLAGWPGRGQAAPYKPGSVGYLYENCKNMLASGERVEDVYQTYCAAFLEGFLTGASIANAVQLPPPRPNDPCEAEKKEDYTRINERICPHFPNYMDKAVTPAFMISTAAHIAQRWVEFHGRRDKNFLSKPAAQTLGDFLQPGPFCDTLAQDAALDAPPVSVNPALLTIEWQSYLDIQKQVTLQRKYAQCKGDIERHEADRKFSFDASWCGGEIEGFMAGLRSTSGLQDHRPAHSPSCARPIDHLYKSLDVRSAMCLKDETRPMDVGRLFLSLYDRGIKTDAGFANLKTLGAVGYETIYKGFLCVGVSRQP
jgi:hypothetical protein